MNPGNVNPKKRILVVEDDIQLADVMKNYVLSLGYEVDILHNAYHVADFIQKNDYAIAFLDVLVPGQSGVDMLRELKQTAHGKVLPMVVLTNVKDEKLKKQAMEMGATDYLIKIDTDLAKVKEIIEQYSR